MDHYTFFSQPYSSHNYPFDFIDSIRQDMEFNMEILKQTFYEDLENLKQILTNSSIQQQYYPSIFEELHEMLFEKYSSMIKNQNNKLRHE